MKIIKLTTMMAFIFTLVLLTACSISPPDKNKMEKYFCNNKNDLLCIRDYLINSGYSEVYIAKSNFNINNTIMFTGLKTGDVNISDQTTTNAILRLFNDYGYSVIEKNGNIIFFQKWTRLMDSGSGIAYSINGEEPTNENITYLTRQEPLSEAGWYYYIDDYNI